VLLGSDATRKKGTAASKCFPFLLQLAVVCWSLLGAFALVENRFLPPVAKNYAS
jgi:hypothetical protein